MRRAGLLILVVLLSVSLPACRFESGGDRNRTLKKDSGVKREGRAKSAKPTSKDKLLLRDALLPAVDVIKQVRDAAMGVTTGYTSPGLAASIISGADGFLVETRSKLIRAKVSAAGEAQKEEATDLIKAVADRLEALTAAVKEKDKAKIEEIVAEIDRDLTGLRKIIDIDPPAPSGSL